MKKSFNIQKFLTENKLTVASRKLDEMSRMHGRSFTFNVVYFEETHEADYPSDYYYEAGGWVYLECNELPGLTLLIGADANVTRGSNETEITRLYLSHAEVVPGKTDIEY